MAEKKKPSLFGKFFKGFTGDKVTSKEIQEAEGIVRRDPNNLRALHKLGDLYAKGEEIDKAIETYIAAAGHYVERAFYQKAVAVYKQILKLRPTMHEIQERLAEVYLELGRRSDALAQYQNLARKHESGGALSLASEMIMKMLQLDEENVPLRVKLAELYLAMNDRTLAVAEFEKALNSLASQEHWADYIKVGERLLFVSPDHLGALKTIARVYLDSGDVMKAMGKLQQAFKLDRRDPETLEVLAVAFDRLEQPEKTISVLKELAEIYDSMGRVDYVRDVYQQILERAPNDPEILRAMAALPASQSSQGLPATVTPSRQGLPALGSNAALPAGVPVIKEPPPPAAPKAPPVPSAPPTPPTTLSPPPAAPLTPPPVPRTARMAPPPAPPTPAPAPPPNEVEPSLSLSEEEIERLLNEADVYIKYGLVPRVEEALNRVLAAVPSHPEARRLKVELLKMQERTEEAANELLSLATETEDPHQALTLLEQILEMEDVSASMQEEAYQMTIRLSPRGMADAGPPPAPAQPFATEPTMQLTEEDDLELIESIDELEAVSIEELPAQSHITASDDDLEIISIEDLDAVSDDSDVLILDEEITADQPFEGHDDRTQAMADGDAMRQQLGLAPAPPSYVQEETQVIDSIDDLDIVELDQEDEAPPVQAQEANPPLFSAPSTPPSSGPSMFAPPKPPPSDDAFGQFLKRAHQDDPIEEEDPSSFKDFLSTPLVVETNDAPAEPTRSSGGEELSEMEAAAARLAALIKAKEDAEVSDGADEAAAEATEEAPVAEEAAPVPPPFALPPAPEPVEAPPAPFTPPPPPPSGAGSDPAATRRFQQFDNFGESPAEDLSAEPGIAPPSSLQADELFADVPDAPPQGFGEDEFAEESFELNDDDFGDLDNAFGDIQEQPVEEAPPIAPAPVSFVEEALEDYEEIEALEFNPDDPFAEEIEEAGLYLDQDEPQYAIEIFDRILQQDPHHELAKAGLNLALEAESRIQEHVHQSDGFYNLDTALGAIATTKRQRERVEGELKAFKEEAEKQFGEDGEALFELGIAYHGMGLYDMGVDSFRSCLRNNYRVFDSHKMIGACYSAQGQSPQALAAYNDALALPGITTEERLDVLFEMGLTHESVGDVSQALACFEEVSLLDEQYRGVLGKIEELQRL